MVLFPGASMPNIQLAKDIDMTATPYADFYQRDMATPNQDAWKIMAGAPLKLNQVTPVTQRFDLLKSGYLPGEIGYASLPDGSAYLANYLYMPGVTTDMLHWWFAWHGLDSARYIIWNKKKHFGVTSNQHERLKDTKLPYEQRIWGVTHTVCEDTGNGPENITLQFKSPEAMGFSKTELAASSTDIISTANGSTAVMLHTARNLPMGVELRSRFWLGYQIDMATKQPVKLIPDGQSVPIAIAQNLGFHSIEEMSNLATILPQLYQQFEDQF